MQSILGWAGRSAEGTFVYTSSTSVYPQTGGMVVDETAPTEGAGANGRILLEASLAPKSGPGVRRWFILRLAGIYGPGRHHLLDQILGGLRRWLEAASSASIWLTATTSWRHLGGLHVAGSRRQSDF